MTWALSPIGGQSSLRLFSHGHHTFETDLDVFVANPEYQESIFGSASGISDNSNAMSTLYSGLLLSAPSQRAEVADLWNRPKIPQLPQAVIDSPTGEWHDISKAEPQNGERYASLLGLDVRGTTQDVPRRQLRFNFNTSYMDLDCKRVTRHRYKNMTQTQSESSFKASLQNHTDRGEPMSWFLNTEPSGHRLYYDSRDQKAEPGGLTPFECVLRRIPVEVEFHCGPFPSTGCGARRLRRREERFDTVPPAWNQTAPEDGLFQILPCSMNPPAVQNMLSFWPIAAGIPDLSYGASATDNFLAGDEALFISQWIRDWDRDASNMTLFSRRMTTVFNTIFQVSLNPRNVTTAISSYIGVGQPSPSHNSWDPSYEVIRATASDTRDIYIADRRWCAILLLVGSILQILAIAGLWLRAWISGPDLLGFASSLMRDNPHFPESVSSCGSALGGADRARVCRNMRVQIADVRPLEETGYIVFKSVSPQGDGDPAWGKHKLSGNKIFE